MVEHTAENRGVAGSIPALATRPCRRLVRFASVMSNEATRDVAVIGAALDLGAGRRGVDMGPSAIRYAGLEARIEELGREYVDLGNVQTAVPEAATVGDERMRYLKEILAACARVADSVEAALERGSCRSSSAATTRSRSGRSAGSRASTAPAACSGSTRTAT